MHTHIMPCIFAVQVRKALSVLVLRLRPKAHVNATSHLFLVLHNGEDLSIKQNINLVSTEYSRPQNSTWLEKGEKIFKK